LATGINSINLLRSYITPFHNTLEHLSLASWLPKWSTFQVLQSMAGSGLTHKH